MRGEAPTFRLRCSLFTHQTAPCPRTPLACTQMVDIAVEHFDSSRLKSLFHAKATGSIHKRPPVCYYGATPMAYMACHGMKKALTKVLAYSCSDAMDSMGRVRACVLKLAETYGLASWARTRHTEHRGITRDKVEGGRLALARYTTSLHVNGRYFARNLPIHTTGTCPWSR